MTRTLLLILCLGFVAACDSGGGSVLQDSTDTDTGTDGENENPIDGDGRTPSLPPGTVNPTPDNSIVRREEQNETGGGYATNIQYRNDQGQDEFIVDNIAFDGNNVYSRGDPATGVAQLGAFAVYEGAETTVDPVTGTSINTFVYRAIYGRSTTGQTEFAIVRSGSYIDYGFGSFIYQRNDKDFDGNSVSLVLPDEGDAYYLGDYAGIRVFQGRGGLEYVQGEAEITVDFKDFNDGNRGVALYVNNRRLFDINGNDVTEAYLVALASNGGGTSGGGLFGGLDNLDDGDPSTATLIIERDANGNAVLPRIRPEISPDIADANGEIAGGIQEIARFDDGTNQSTATGTYYAIMSGETVGEIVGVLVIEGSDPRVSGTTFQETGGFVVYRQ
jgi:hypothetical protein